VELEKQCIPSCVNFCITTSLCASNSCFIKAFSFSKSSALNVFFISLKSAQNGIYMMPIVEGKVIEEEEFEKLEESVKQHYEEKSTVVQQQHFVQILLEILL